MYRRCCFPHKLFIFIIINRGYASISIYFIIVCINVLYFRITWALTIFGSFFHLIFLPNTCNFIIPNSTNRVPNKPAISHIISFFYYCIAQCINYGFIFSI